MNLYHLRVFLTVATHEHITRASKELILSQPAVTKIIQSLEHEAGCALIERHGRRIGLTYAGRLLQGYARRIFALEREMEEELRALRDVEAGEVLLAANPTSGVYLLPPVVARFRARYPRVHLRINILNSQEILEQTLGWNLDFGLVEGDPASLPEELRVEVFAQDELVLVVAPGHHWSQQSMLRPEVLRDQQLLLREQGSGVREVIEQAFLALGVQIRPLFTLSDNAAIKQMVMGGVGAAIVSALTVQREIEAGALLHIPIVGVSLQPQLSLVMRADKQLSRAAEAFSALLRSRREEGQEEER